MKTTVQIAMLLALLSFSFACGRAVAQSAAAEGDAMPTISTLQALLAEFNAHDLDRIMEFFADDCELYMPRGKEPWGQRFVGKPAVRAALATRFEGIPNVHYGEDQHWVDGNVGISTWLLTGTTQSGESISVRGVDLLEFRKGKIVKKDSYWKIVEH
jgi:ketosteroid isomerase-like protein